VGGATRNKGSDFSADVGAPANIEPNHSSCQLRYVVLNLAMLQRYHPEFLTATILNWNHLLARDQIKTIIVDSL
jgi:hypothetical protein